MEMVNGYVFLDLTKTNVYAKALKVLESGKPVVVKDGSGAPYFVDSMNVDGTNVVITKGGKTITIANDNTITSVGDVQNHLYTHNITLQVSVTGDSISDMYLTFTIIDTNSVKMDLDEVKSYLNKFNWSTDEILSANASGDNTYVGISKDTTDYMLLSGDTNYPISDMSLYNDKVIQIF